MTTKEYFKVLLGTTAKLLLVAIGVVMAESDTQWVSLIGTFAETFGAVLIMSVGLDAYAFKKFNSEQEQTIADLKNKLTHTLAAQQNSVANEFSMSKDDIEKYATGAANTLCRCFKCDGIRNDTHEKCGPKPCNTCNEWYNAYRGASLALYNIKQELEREAK